MGRKRKDSLKAAQARLEQDRALFYDIKAAEHPTAPPAASLPELEGKIFELERSNESLQNNILRLTEMLEEKYDQDVVSVRSAWNRRMDNSIQQPPLLDRKDTSELLNVIMSLSAYVAFLSRTNQVLSKKVEELSPELSRRSKKTSPKASPDLRVHINQSSDADAEDYDQYSSRVKSRAFRRGYESEHSTTSSRPESASISPRFRESRLQRNDPRDFRRSAAVRPSVSSTRNLPRSRMERGNSSGVEGLSSYFDESDLASLSETTRKILGFGVDGKKNE